MIWLFPIKSLIAGDAQTVLSYVSESKKVCGSRAKLKVIIESGELKTEALITRATQLAIEGGADFVKTSTGKVAINATLESTKIMLTAIKNSGKRVGFKAAGGVKTVADASDYLRLARAIMGDDYLQANTFQLWCFKLIEDVYRCLKK